MQIDIISVQPMLLESPFAHSIMKRAEEKGLLTVKVHDLHQYGIGKKKQVDDYAYGGGAGMVMMIEPIYNCIQDLKTKRTYSDIIYMSPDGEQFTQKVANQLSLQENLILICGHYKGIDERVREHLVTREISIGDFVLSGGELPAAIIVDAIGRLLPGVLNDETSALTDSFQDDLIAPPVFTRPANFNNWEVPAVLTSGHTAKVEAWRYEKSIERTKERRPDLLKDDM